MSCFVFLYDVAKHMREGGGGGGGGEERDFGI